MRLLKIDTIYPLEFLNKEKATCLGNLNSMNLSQYRNWLIKLRANYSDFYTYNLSTNGFITEEYFANDDLFGKKVAIEYYGPFRSFIKLYHRFRNLVSLQSVPFNERLLKKHIRQFKPDILFIREQTGIRSEFWEQYLTSKLVVVRIDCAIPKKWSPRSFDLIYTNIPSFIEFFTVNGMTVKQNSNGFDSRVLNEVKYSSKKYDLTFVGGLGTYHGFLTKTKTFEKILELLNGTVNFAWWGYKTGNFDVDFPNLSKYYKGELGGIEMFRVYAESKIVINDYGTGFNIAVNQRIYEVLGMGTLLLTRNNLSLSEFNEKLVTFNDVDECVAKIRYYLDNVEEAKKIAKAGQDYILDNFTYKQLMNRLGEELKSFYHTKFPSKSI